MRKLIKNFAGFISDKNEYTRIQEEQIEYALRITIFEALKILGLVLIFTLLGFPKEALVSVGTMALIKPFIGGYHEDTQIKCFIASLMIIGSVIYISSHLTIDIISKLILSIVCLYCIWNQAPVVHPKMAITRAELINRNRNVGLFLTAACIIISVIFNRNKIVSDSILWIILFQTLLMFNKRETSNT